MVDTKTDARKSRSSNVSVPVSTREIPQQQAVIPQAKYETCTTRNGKERQLIPYYIVCSMSITKIPFEINLKKNLYLDVLGKKRA